MILITVYMYIISYGIEICVKDHSNLNESLFDAVTRIVEFISQTSKVSIWSISCYSNLNLLGLNEFV